MSKPQLSELANLLGKTVEEAISEGYNIQIVHRNGCKYIFRGSNRDPDRINVATMDDKIVRVVSIG